jgi:cytochrome c biogenesis protein CcmG/thiol:disulfide interchange protein DsbE
VKRIAVVMVIAGLVSACASATVDPGTIDPLAPTTPADVRQLLAASDQPVVLNVWASWCAPCRSEAPLLRSAHTEYGDVVTFLGIDVRDSQDGARSFIAEFGLEGFTHLFDASGAVPDDLGGFGVPLTFFFAPGGELVAMHSGVIDERTLALQIDEITAGTR